MKTFLIILSSCISIQLLHAQTENSVIRKGNKLYREEKFEAAAPEYRKALEKNSTNPVTSYNLGNTEYRLKNFTEAEQSFDQAIALTKGSPELQQKAYYNKGLALYNQKKLEASIEAWKTALKMNPSDEDTRINLQKALSELKKQQQPEDKPQQQEKKQQQEQQQKKPEPNQSKLDRRRIEQYLKSLQQKEQEVQRKIQQNRTPSVSKPEKDW